MGRLGGKVKEEKREYGLFGCEVLCVCVEPLVCGRLDKGAAGQRWQVKPM